MVMMKDAENKPKMIFHVKLRGIFFWGVGKGFDMSEEEKKFESIDHNKILKTGDKNINNKKIQRKLNDQECLV